MMTSTPVVPPAAQKPTYHRLVLGSLSKCVVLPPHSMFSASTSEASLNFFSCKWKRKIIAVLTTA